MEEPKKFSDEEIEKYLEAGKIASKIKKRIEGKIREGIKVEELCEEVEEEIVSLGGNPAFPCNIGINEVAAHYTAKPGDELTIPPGALVKVDYGVHIDGYIVDTAFSVALSNSDKKIVEEVEKALETVVSELKVGDRLSKVGNIVSEVAKKNGYLVISNLYGHEIKRFNLHAGLSIPNIPNKERARLENGMVIAIEPFFTYSFGKGYVKEEKTAVIFKLSNPKKAPKELYEKFNNLPFCERWIRKKNLEMLVKGIPLIKYNVLVEAGRAPVAQRETTIMAIDDKVVNLVS